jgi:hypothetical protein
MPTRTRTVKINAAFLRKAKKDNSRLRKLLRRADRTLSLPSPRADAPRRVAKLVAELRDQLSMHFALEEMFGYFDDSMILTPELLDACETLRREHVPLFLEICDIAERAERVAYHETPEKELRRVGLRFRAFLDQLLTHESREIDLILQALVVDVDFSE